MEQYRIFSILDTVDSTNNYAMAQVHAGLAKHGNAWFSHSQTAGKGQRGKSWESNAGQNILLSLITEPSALNKPGLFLFNASIAILCTEFLSNLISEQFKVKWPNDLYWRDRKAGGILIENVLQGAHLKWSVTGIGININQIKFSKGIGNPVSIRQISGREYVPADLARQLHEYILTGLAKFQNIAAKDIMHLYNEKLYKKNEQVLLRKDNVVFKTMIKEVDEFGNLHTMDAFDRTFSFGEVDWIIE